MAHCRGPGHHRGRELCVLRGGEARLHTRDTPGLPLGRVELQGMRSQHARTPIHTRAHLHTPTQSPHESTRTHAPRQTRTQMHMDTSTRMSQTASKRKGGAGEAADRQKRHETGSLGRFSGRASQSRSAFRVPGVTQKWMWDSGVLSLDTELQVSMKGSLKGPWGSGSEMPTKHGLVLPPACVQMDSRVCASSRAHARA